MTNSNWQTSTTPIDYVPIEKPIGETVSIFTSSAQGSVPPSSNVASNAGQYILAQDGTWIPQPSFSSGGSNAYEILRPAALGTTYSAYPPTVTNTSYAYDADTNHATTFAEFECASQTRINTITDTLTYSTFASRAQTWTAATINVSRAYGYFNDGESNATSGASNRNTSVKIEYSIDSGSNWFTIATDISTSIPSTATTSFGTLSTTTPTMANILVKLTLVRGGGGQIYDPDTSANLPGSTGDIDLKVYDIWISGTYTSGAGNITCNDLLVTGNATLQNKLFDGSGSAGTAGYILSSTGTKTAWVPDSVGSGTVTSITAGTGLSGGVITTSGTITIDTAITVDKTTSQTLTNKTLTSPTISSIVNTGTLTLPTSTDTLVGRATTDTLTNKTISGSANTLSNIANASLTNSTISGVALGSNLNALTISSPLSGTSFNGSAAVSIGIPVATTSVNGYLSSTDWTTFNNKGSGTVTSVTGTSPVISSGGTTPAISIPAATTSVSGYLSSTDWTTFNNKGSGSVTSVTGGTYLTGGTITTTGTLAVDATSANTASKVVARDASGNFSAGTITANLTGNASGSSGSTTGNAATATALQTARAINGTNFDGTAAITVTAAAGTLTGATLASGVTASSLTSVGTLTGLTVSGTTSLATTSGNVGIGTTPSAWYTTFKALQVAGNGSALFGRAENNDCGLVSNGYVNTSGNWTYTNSGYAGLYEILNGQHIWATAGSSTGTISFSERMRIDNSGNVGIGTASPVTLKSATTLQVYGNIKVGNDNARGLISLGDVSSTGANAGIWRGAAGAYGSTGNYLCLGGYDGITFTTGNADIASQTERMRIDTTQVKATVPFIGNSGTKGFGGITTTTSTSTPTGGSSGDHYYIY